MAAHFDVKKMGGTVFWPLLHSKLIHPKKNYAQLVYANRLEIIPHGPSGLWKASFKFDGVVCSQDSTCRNDIRDGAIGDRRAARNW